MDDFGRILGPQNHEKTLKSVELSAKNKVFTIFAWSLQKERQKLTKPSPERPQGPQKRPRRRQERSRRAPRAPRERPRSRQEAPENRSKRTFAAGEPQERPGEAQEPPQRGPGSDFGASRASFGSFLGAPGTSFLSFFRSCPRTLRLQPLCPTNAGSAGPALAFTISPNVSNVPQKSSQFP